MTNTKLKLIYKLIKAIIFYVIGAILLTQVDIRIYLGVILIVLAFSRN